ncbi:MAG: shikimate dehydrogenase [Burkholderiales bacterium]
MSARYAVIGNPVAHSKSPEIHAAFARQTGQDMSYEAMLAPLDGFAAAVKDFINHGGRGMNVTLPFKEQAFQLAAPNVSVRAGAAGAVNTLSFDEGAIAGDNTDGTGLIRDIQFNLLRATLTGLRILLLGAGGAARGVILPLLMFKPVLLTVANRTLSKAQALEQRFAQHGNIKASAYAALAGKQYDLVINATSASVAGALPPLPENIFAADALAYDLMYGQGLTPFLQFAQRQGAARLADGTGMLVEQAAESFYFWRGMRPDTAPVIARLKSKE